MNQVEVYGAVQDLFSQTAARFAGSTAVESGGRRVTYGELDARAERLASALTSLGAAAGSMVGVFTNDPVEVITSILGSLKAGAVFCPLDPSFPEKRLEVMFASISPRWCVTEARHHARLLRLAESAGAPTPEIILLDQDLAAGAGLRPGPRPTAFPDPEAPCSIYFTSGSTGKPKAILGKLKGIDHYVRWEIDALGVGPGTRVSQLASPSFDGFLKDAFVPLCAGGTVCAPESRDVVLDASRLVDWLNAEQIEVLHCVPSVFRSIINEGVDDRHFAAMRYVVTAGEALLPSDVKRWMDAFGERVRLVNLYGPTETTILKLFHFVKPEDAARPSIPIGKPMKGAAVLVVDQQNQPCAVGDVGEIYIRTPYCAHGYHGEPA
ncbi:MAG: AMP-binding protein, partial [Pyrinomonadaceae bacterium]